MKKVAKDKYLGCLIGGAVGDALGAPVEFMSISGIRQRFGPGGITGYVEYEDSAGEFTDDTQMTLFTAEALLRAAHRAMLKGIGGALNTIAYRSYLRWLFTQGIEVESGFSKDGWLINQEALYKIRAPGNTCLMALKSGKAGSINNPINDSKGCGTIMRMAPVGLMYFGDNRAAFKTGCDLSAITHGHPSGYLSGGFFASLISDLAVDINLEISIENAMKNLKEWPNHKETLAAVEKALKLYKNTKSSTVDVTPEILESLGGGWIAEEALSISIFASLLFKNNYKDGVLYSVNHSGDCDSTGSITGNILGLINGVHSIPEKWIDNLRHKDIVETIAEDLYLGIKGDSFNMDEEWREKYPGKD